MLVSSIWWKAFHVVTRSCCAAQAGLVTSILLLQPPRMLGHRPIHSEGHPELCEVLSSAPVLSTPRWCSTVLVTPTSQK